MAKIKDSIEDTKNLINEELDYLYQREQQLLRNGEELLNNISQVMELRQDLLNGIKDDLKKLQDVWQVDSEIGRACIF